MKNIFDAWMRMLFRIPFIQEQWSRRFRLRESETVPWTPLRKSLRDCRISLVTTGGVHLRSDQPFDMSDRNGDPTLRFIPSSVEQQDVVITHDYYDHRDAEKDINLVFPIDILREGHRLGWTGEVADTCYGLMGHIDGPHIRTLVEDTACRIVRNLRKEEVDIVLLVPA